MTVRNYVKKRSGPSYTPNDLEKAVNAVKSGSLTYNQAFEEFNVPKAVVFNRIKGRKTPMSCTKAGRSRVFSDEIELVLEKCLIARSKMGYPCDKNEFKELVGHFIKQSNFITPFKNGIPGDDWYYGFMKRHPKLSFKKPEQLQKVRKDARKPEVVYDFYEKLMDVVVANNMQNRPEFFFNADESGFHTDPSKLKAIGEKGQPFNRIVGGSGRESISVLACVSADGKYLPPLIVFKGCAVQARWTSPKAYPGTFYAVSKNGWMEESVFFNWFSQCFVHHVQQLRQYNNNESQTALLLFDGHCSHISIRIFLVI
ncbi:uncharacterized protein LOC132933051 [Metopolophium dirhodum]|uniref:uncharacterized protein LOC132933051 n=1 Tax=Metopolophium dirhodum TaxID=44670 RepID=UPI0029901516|nr:uncharacterized protein LOC132933051 [Metopolophium dirhodum]